MPSSLSDQIFEQAVHQLRDDQRRLRDERLLADAERIFRELLAHDLNADIWDDVKDWMKAREAA